MLEFNTFSQIKTLLIKGSLMTIGECRFISPFVDFLKDPVQDLILKGCIERTMFRTFNLIYNVNSRHHKQ